MFVSSGLITLTREAMTAEPEQERGQRLPRVGFEVLKRQLCSAGESGRPLVVEDIVI